MPAETAARRPSTGHRKTSLADAQFEAAKSKILDVDATAG
jgi:hypothetical protein